MFNFQKKVYLYIRRTFKYYIKRRRKLVYEILRPYMEEVLTLSSFLFISSSFIFVSKKEDQYFNFNWRSFFRIYMPGVLDLWSSCAIRYVLDVNSDFSKKYQVESQIPSLSSNFSIQYSNALKGHKKTLEGLKTLDYYIKKQILLMDIVLKVHCLYHKEIPKDPSKVMDLIWNLTKFKKLISDVFEYKAEYILFCFLVNLAN